MEWNRRVAVEKDLDKEKSIAFQNMRICWDYSGNFLLYPSIIGVKVRLLLFFLCLFKVYNFVTEKVVREIGKEETVRITSVALCRWVLRSF